MGYHQIGLDLSDTNVTAAQPQAACIAGKEGGTETHPRSRRDIVQQVVPNIKYVMRGSVLP
jgi:hypothetical protein